MNDLLTRKQLSEKLQLSERQIVVLYRAGDFPAPIQVGKRDRWLTSTIDAYLQEQAEQQNK